MTHTCHAHGCSVEISPKFFMCPRHWRMVPAPLKAAIWDNYRPGQEVDKEPTVAYLDAAAAAKAAVRTHEQNALWLRRVTATERRRVRLGSLFEPARDGN